MVHLATPPRNSTEDHTQRINSKVMSYTKESDSENDIMSRMMVEMSKLIQSLYSLVLNQQKQNARRDEHFHKLSQRVYANSFSQTMSARALADN